METSARKTIHEMFLDRGFTEYKGIYKNKEGLFADYFFIYSISEIKNYSHIIEDLRYDTILFVYINNVTETHKELEKNFDFKIEIWPLKKLLINISKHELQPKIEPLRTQEKFPYKLPRISFYDPLIRYYRIPHKTVIKITDNDGFIHYRLVV
nr:MAG: hypothetical protein DiTV3a_F12ORF1 [Diabrotica toursvirus 3a]